MGYAQYSEIKIMYVIWPQSTRAVCDFYFSYNSRPTVTNKNFSTSYYASVAEISWNHAANHVR